jgi:hypothetical protein
MNDNVFFWFWIVVFSLIGGGVVVTAILSRGPML